MKLIYLIISLIFCQITLGQNGLYITSGSTIDGNTITLSDADLNNSGTFNGSLTMTGTNIDDTFIINNGIINLTKLTIDGSNGVYIEAGEVNVSSAINLNSDNALLVMGNTNIILGPSAQINNESNDRPIFGDDGTFIKTTRDHSAGIANDFGGIGLQVSNGNTSMGSTEIYRRYDTFDIAGEPTVKRYYEINPTVNSGLNIDAQFYFLDDDLNGLDRSTLAAFRSTDNGVTFTEEGGIPETLFHSVLNIDAFSLWAFAEASTLNVENPDDGINSIAIFPNPANSFVNITSDIGTVINSIELVNVSGQKIETSLSDDNSFDVSNLSDGIYFLKIISENGFVTKQLVVKK